MQKLKGIFYFYQRAMWYFGIAISEARKPLQLWNEAALLGILLAFTGIKMDVPTIAFLYILVVIIGVIVGKILVKIGVVSYLARISNHQNPELMQILEHVKKIEKSIESLKRDGRD